MTYSFLGIETLTRGLYTQQVNQNVVASNLAKTYRDEDGYVVASRQRMDVATTTPYYLGSSSGVHAIGTGSGIQQVTRLRSMYLDFQIQKQSQVVGYDEVLTEVLDQVQGILAGDVTLDSSLTTLTTAFAALAADPTDIGLRDDVVNAGKSFADLARQQYAGLEALQISVNTDVVETVGDINNLLQQLSSINQALIQSPAANNNDLLDARDYALTKLSRLLNVQVSFGSKGIANVYLGGLSLVNSEGNATLSAGLINNHNVTLSDIQYKSYAGTTMEVTSKITGGRLGGQLQARDTALEYYKSALDQCVHSIIDVANTLHEAGYGSDGTTTNISFFTGVSARDININATMYVDTTRSLVAASSRYGDTTNGEIATFMSNLRNLQADDYMASQPTVKKILGGSIDPTQALNSLVTTALNGSGNNNSNWRTPFLAGGGTFMVNSVTVTYAETDSLYDVLDKINAADPNVQAVFNYTDQRIYILSNNTTTLTNVSPGAKGFLAMQNFLTSTIRMNNGFSPEDLKIDPTLALSSAANQQAFRVTPSATFTVSINGTSYTFDNLDTLNSIGTAINSPTLGFQFDAATQEILLRADTPISVVDVEGNFKAFTGLNGSHRIGELTDSLDNQVVSDYDSAESTATQAQDALDQLNNAQASTAALAYTDDESGVPYETESANAVKALIAYNACLQIMHLMDQMLSDLVSIVGGASSSTFALREG